MNNAIIMPINIDVNKIKPDKANRLIIRVYCIVLLVTMVGFMILVAHNILAGKHGKL